MLRFETLTWPVTIGLIGDTHVAHDDWRVPDWITGAFRDVDLILHLGDVCHPSVLIALKALAPVRAVRGNNDPPELAERLPAQRWLQAGPVSIGVLHGHEPVLPQQRTARERALAAFTGVVHVGVYGHSHWPEVVQHPGGLLLVNPGSPTQPRRSNRRCVGILTITDTIAARLVEGPPVRQGGWLS